MSSAGVLAHSDVDDLRELIQKRIDNLRPKLLDLSRRNPLVATKLTPRSNSHVRVVDELPDVLYGNLSAQKEMRFVPLPALDEDPRDERTREFRDALSEARLTDKEWMAAADEIDPSSDENIELFRRAERSLKDRVRESLNMGPRQVAGDTSLKQHAINNGISPSYDLPTEGEQHEDGRHTDKDIQTLLLPDDLERKMNALMTKCRTWIQETGIHVLYAAFGFLEWEDPKGNQTSFAPLILLPVELEKVKTREGLEFRVVGTEDQGETNTVLLEKLKHDFGLDIPRYEEGSLEEYFDQISGLSPKSLSWKVRRQVVFGVFPSARIAMYHDLDTSNGSVEFNKAVSKLLAGSTSTVASVYGDEYEVDHPEIEVKVPCLVLDADSSQFSTMIDVADGKDLAVEGPPGTGKSQTIVNTIAAVLNEGKKVLFVAEKSAALNVVKSRLEAIGLGEFILPLQAERSTREQVIQSIRDRLEMTAGRPAADLESKIHAFKQTRGDLQDYINAISATVGATGFTVFEVLGKAIAQNELLDSLPKPLHNPRVDRIDEYNNSQISSVRELAKAVETAWNETLSAEKYWDQVKVTNLDKFSADEICELAEAAATAIQFELEAAVPLAQYQVSKDLPIQELMSICETLKKLSETHSQKTLDVELVKQLVDDKNWNSVQTFTEQCRLFQGLRDEVSDKFKKAPVSGDSEILRAINDLCTKHAIETLDLTAVRHRLQVSNQELVELRRVHETLKPFKKCVPDCEQWSLESLKVAAEIVDSYPAKVLALRNESMTDPSAPSIVEQMGKLARDLRNRKKNLADRISITRNTLSPIELTNHLRALNSGSIFSSLMPEYRAAKKAYLSISRRNNFNKSIAIDDMNSLLDLLEGEETLFSNKKAFSIFGQSFGLETDFDSFDALVSFYQQVDSKLPGLQNRKIRSFLKNDDLDLLQALPKIESSLDVDTIEDVGRLIKNHEAAVASIQDAISELETLCSHLRNPAEIPIETLLPLAAKIDEYIECMSKLSSATTAQLVLGSKFEGCNTTKEHFAQELSAAESIRLLKEHANIALAALSMNEISKASEVVSAYMGKHQASASALAALSERSGITIDSLATRTTSETVVEFLQNASRDKPGLYAHSNYATALEDLRLRGFDWVVSCLLKNDLALHRLDNILEAVIFRALSRFVYGTHTNVLTKFPGRKLDECRDRLARLDREILELSRRSLRSKLHRISNPPAGVGYGRKSEWSDMALIENELGKKKRFVSVRDLTHRAGRALVELKPCWMMSPLAVANYLRKEDITFDLVIIDEASQMPPEDALGALIRAKQVMVVGDTNQLPPTSFFRKMVEDEDVDEDEAVLEESILEMANAAFRPPRRLRWHYRSRHSALINFSNQMVYNGDLIVFPSAAEQRPDMGVSLVAVKGRYSSGANGEEAKAMIDATLQFMKTHPDRSLGVVVLNQKQRDLLLEEFEYALSKDTTAAKYVERWSERNDGLEQFFIKNLENVQGDERDVIFIGTVCGPEELGGPVDHRCFGPINGLAGKRRLNVLFSRAKQQIITFSSMSSADIRADENTNPGVYMLKRWLEYCATGYIHTGVKTNKSTDSDFEDFVMNQIRSMGCEPVPQVGAAGYFIDIGVKHPEWPHGYVLAVECDGATYHSSKSARDRDRLRQEVLEGLGWHFHRIWSTDWFNDPRKQAERLRESITMRMEQLRAKSSSFVQPSIGEPTEQTDDDLDEDDDDVADDVDGDEDESEIDDDQDESSNRTLEEITAAEISESIVSILNQCPNYSCTLSSLTKRVLKTFGVLTRGKPRAKFKRRVMQSVTNLVYREVVEKYRAKNERVRLLDYKQLKLVEF